MKVAFIVRNNDSEKFVLTDGLDFESAVCIYDTVSHCISWRSLADVNTNDNSLALSLFGMGIQRVVSSYLDAVVARRLQINEILVLKASGHDLIENIKLYNQHLLHEMHDVNRQYTGYIYSSSDLAAAI